MENEATTLVLKTAPFFNPPQPHLRESAQREIEAVTRILLRHLPGVTVLLTGSLSAGEGKTSERAKRPVILSDYDLVAVTPRLLDSFPSLVRKKLQVDMGGIRLSADLDISLVWRPFLLHGVTTTAGLVIAGKKGLERHLKALKPPSAYKADLISYRFLARAPLDVSQYSMLISKAVVRSAQAFLLDRFSSHPRSVWVHCSSARFIHDAIERYSDVIGSENVGLVQKACHALQGSTGKIWTKSEYGGAYGLLNRLSASRIPPLRCQDFLKHILWLKQHQLAGYPCIRPERHALKSLKLLCISWDGDKLDIARLGEANRSVKNLCHTAANKIEGDPLDSYTRLLALLTGYIDFYPHKLRYPCIARQDTSM